eukprot:6461923-Amphidinium_carterae.2
MSAFTCDRKQCNVTLFLPIGGPATEQVGCDAKRQVQPWLSNVVHTDRVAFTAISIRHRLRQAH